MLEIIYAIQVVLAIMFALWTYDRYAKRWPVTLGDDVVTGSVVDVGYLHLPPSSASPNGYVIVSYGYSVSDKRYFGSFYRELDNWTNPQEFEDKMRKEYPKGYEVTVFYYRDSPAEHWLHKPPPRWAIFWKAFWLPALLLVLTYIPLMFISLLISLRAGWTLVSQYDHCLTRRICDRSLLEPSLPEMCVHMQVPTPPIISHWINWFFIEYSSLKRRFYEGLGDVKELDFASY